MDNPIDFSAYFYWDHHFDTVILINLAMIIVLFTSLRVYSGVISHIDAKRELIVKDNPAFGVSLAAMVFAVTIILSGTIYGKPANTITEAVIAVGVYGVAGILLLALSRILFDKLSLPNLVIGKAITDKNMAVSIMDAGNVIASAIVIRSVMIWVTPHSIEGVIALIAGFAISQLLLTGVMILRRKYFRKRFGESLQTLLESGNKAVALRFAGRRIGAAFAIMAASEVMFYELYNLGAILLIWTLIACLLIAFLGILNRIADWIIMYNIQLDDEVIRQGNIALGATQAVISISLGLLLAELMI